MNLDNNYQIYNGRGKKVEESELNILTCTKFKIIGKPDFGMLDSLKGFERRLPLLYESRADSEETWVYRSNFSTIVIFANYAKDYHELDIILKEKGLENRNTMEITRLKIEDKLGFELSNPLEQKSISSLIKDVGEN